MQYFPGSQFGELIEYTTQDSWVVFVPASKKTFLFPRHARLIIDLIGQAETQTLSKQNLEVLFHQNTTNVDLPEELLARLVNAGILSCH
ncbi:hypothetical protein [Bowmanella dokdonensis]|uniref:Uncharacterized protein n=1 Tax=Bowmanella dokdonensis TaxID=751969 RepID=A0A939DS11_9ALTE|nr:hypothetical protein [Bowmanella dokdonensis]MBN7827292.1 hypothetical protein [Bowmanella dokdonensis]